MQVVLSQLVTFLPPAYEVRREFMFSVCSHLGGGGGGYPISMPQYFPLVPMSFLGWYPSPGKGVPHSWLEGTPHGVPPAQDGYPPGQVRMGYPPGQVRMGTLQAGLGYPLARTEVLPPPARTWVTPPPRTGHTWDRLCHGRYDSCGFPQEGGLVNNIGSFHIL